MDAKTTAALKKIGAVAEGSYFALPKDMKPYVDAKLAEGNPAIQNPKDKKQIAFRLTDAGKAAIAPATPAGAAAVSAFTIAKVKRPKIGRLESGPSKYPFEKLDNDEAFFIPSPEGMKSPSKSFGSMVSAANKKYGDEDDFRRFTTRSMTGDDFGQPGVKGVGVFRKSVEEEEADKAKAFPAA